MNTLRLKKSEDRRIRAGHAWIFSNEINVKETPLKGLPAGELARIESANGRFLGTAYVNPASLISGRMLSNNLLKELDQAFFSHKIEQALSLREALYQTQCYRLVYGESDGLPGLVVDRYGDYLVIQIGTAGMELQREHIVAALLEVLKPKGILLRNNSDSRGMEGLDRYVSVAYGEIPEPVVVTEGDCQFQVSLTTGQKTGWFYDQCSNRLQLASWSKDKEALDLFAYVGAWGVQMAKSGARSVLCCDSSGDAIARLRSNAELNGVSDRIQTEKKDAFLLLKRLHEQEKMFDVINLDPPAFIKHKKDKKAGFEAYQRVNNQAMRQLRNGGLFVSSSCSYHLEEAELVQMVRRAAQKLGKTAQIIAMGNPAPDHPVAPAIRETRYLKTVFARVIEL